MILECPYAKAYKARQPPKCDCVTCHVRYLQVQVTELKALVRTLNLRTTDDAW